MSRGNIENLSTKNERQIEWRRNKIPEIDSQGYSQIEISTIMKISIGTVNKDLQYLKERARENIKKYVDEKLPEEYEKCLVGVNSILKEAWMTAQQAQGEREKLQALNLAKECYSMKMDMLTNATVIDDAIRFINVNTSSKEGKS